MTRQRATRGARNKYEAMTDSCMQQAFGRCGAACGLGAWSVFGLLVVGLVALGVGMGVFSAAKWMFGNVSHLRVGNQAEMRRMWGSGEAWLVLCRDSAKGPFERVMEGFHDAADVLEDVHVATLDCNTPLPSGKTTFERLGASPQGGLVAFTLGNGKGPKRVPDQLLEKIAQGKAKGGKGKKRKGGKKEYGGAFEVAGQGEQAVRQLVKHAEGVVDVKVVGMRGMKELKQCVGVQEGGKGVAVEGRVFAAKEWCFVVVTHGKLGEEDKKMVKQARLMHRKPLFYALDSARTQIQGVEGEVGNLLQAPRRKEAAAAVLGIRKQADTLHAVAIAVESFQETTQAIDALSAALDDPTATPDPPFPHHSIHKTSIPPSRLSLQVNPTPSPAARTPSHSRSSQSSPPPQKRRQRRSDRNTTPSPRPQASKAEKETPEDESSRAREREREERRRMDERAKENMPVGVDEVDGDVVAEGDDWEEIDEVDLDEL